MVAAEVPREDAELLIPRTSATNAEREVTTPTTALRTDAGVVVGAEVVEEGSYCSLDILSKVGQLS